MALSIPAVCSHGKPWSEGCERCKRKSPSHKYMELEIEIEQWRKGYRDLEKEVKALIAVIDIKNGIIQSQGEEIKNLKKVKGIDPPSPGTFSALDFLESGLSVPKVAIDPSGLNSDKTLIGPFPEAVKVVKSPPHSGDGLLGVLTDFDINYSTQKFCMAINTAHDTACNMALFLKSGVGEQCSGPFASCVDTSKVVMEVPLHLFKEGKVIFTKGYFKIGAFKIKIEPAVIRAMCRVRVMLSKDFSFLGTLRFFIEFHVSWPWGAVYMVQATVDSGGVQTLNALDSCGYDFILDPSKFNKIIPGAAPVEVFDSSKTKVDYHHKVVVLSM